MSIVRNGVRFDRTYAGPVTGFKRRKFWNEVTQSITANTSVLKQCVPIKYAISKEGFYIGNTKTAHRLNRKYGIVTFEKVGDNGRTCAIGWSEKHQSWFGWSHRAIAGFRTKKAARRFAKSVS